MNANGRVVTGFSHPYVAKYNNNGGTVTYTDGMRLARGVNVSLDVEVSEGNDFYADNEVAESENGQFSKGKLNLTVDGLHPEAERFVLGLPEPVTKQIGEDKTVNIQQYPAAVEAPYVGVGFIIEYRSGGVDLYVPMIVTKGKFQTPGTKADTREDSRNWQTQDLVADIARDDTPKHNWKWVADGQTTEAEADAILQALLGITAAAAEPEAAAEG